jgi:hypothetical protein
MRRNIKQEVASTNGYKISSKRKKVPNNEME